MMKAISKVFIVFSACILTITSSLFSVSADYDGALYYIPTEAMACYNFFSSYGLDLKEWANLGVSKQTEEGYSMTENQYTVVIPKQYYTSTVRGIYDNNSTQSVIDYFVSTNNQATTLGFENGAHIETVNSHTISVPQHITNEQNWVMSYKSYGVLSADSLNNPTSYTNQNHIQILGSKKIILAFIINKPISTFPPTYYVSTGNNSNVRWKQESPRVLSGGSDLGQTYKYVYSIENLTNSALYVSINFNVSSNSNIKVIPLYLGYDTQLNDELAQTLGLDTETEVQLKITNQYLSTIEQLIRGDSETQDLVNNNDSTTDNLNDTSNEYHSIENNSINDMQSQLNNINLDNNLYSNTGFVDGAWFVKKVFTDIVETYNESIGIKLVIMFSLILGLALTIIGKLRN